MRKWNEAFVNKSVISVHSGSHAWPVKFDNVNIAFSLKKERVERGRRGMLLPTHHWQQSHGKRDGGMDEEMKTSIKMLMGQIQSIESHDKRPQLARMGQALTMKFSTYLPACALYNRENTAQINTQVTITPFKSPDSLQSIVGNNCFWKIIHYCSKVWTQ